jgi:hypothetical protein
MKKARPRVSLKRETVRVLKPIHLAVAAGADNSEHCVAQAVVVSGAPACVAG